MTSARNSSSRCDDWPSVPRQLEPGRGAETYVAGLKAKLCIGPDQMAHGRRSPTPFRATIEEWQATRERRRAVRCRSEIDWPPWSG